MTDTILSYLDAHLDDYLAELEPLVNQDSGSYVKAGVDLVTARLQARFERMGFTVERAEQGATGRVEQQQSAHRHTLGTPGPARPRLRSPPCASGSSPET